MLKKTLMLTAAALLASPVVAGEYQDGPFPTSITEVASLRAAHWGIDDCDEQLDEANYCVLRDWDGADMFIESYIVVSKDDYADQQELFDRFIAFGDWDQYVADSDLDGIIDFPVSEILSDNTDSNGLRTLVHLFSYRSKAPVPVNSLQITGTSTYKLPAQPAAGALISATFSNTRTWGAPWQLITPIPASYGLEKAGILGQEANIHVVQPSDDTDSFLLIYRTQVRTEIGLFPRLSSRYVEGALRTLLHGMLDI